MKAGKLQYKPTRPRAKAPLMGTARVSEAPFQPLNNVMIYLTVRLFEGNHFTDKLK